MKKYLLFLLSITIIIFSCKKNENQLPVVNKENLLNNNAHIIDTLSILNITPTSIALSKTNSTYRPILGDIIIAIPFSGRNFGILSKVTSVTESNNQFTCNIVQSNLNEAFKQLNINFNYVDTFSSGQIFGPTGSTLSVSFNANNTIANGIGLDGRITFKLPSTRFEFIKRSGTLKPDKVLIQTDFGIDESTLEIKNTSTSAINVISEKTLITFDLPTIMILIPVGPIVIPIPITQQLIIKILPISITGKAKWTVIPKITATLGVKYENSTWSNLNTYLIDASASSLYQGDFDPTLSLVATATIIKPVYEIKPYGLEVLKGFFEVPNDLELNIQNLSPNYSLKYKLDVTGGIKQSFWTGDEQEYSLTGHLIEKTILEGNWPPSTVVDVDGNVYHTVTIGSQTWLLENLKASHYRNGDPIPTGLSDAQWHSTTIGGYSVYNNDPANNNTYGKLYNWYAVKDSRNIAPVGWHVPSEAEWNSLINYLGGTTGAGGKLKAVSNLWTNPNTGATNSSGFTALPAGWRQDGNWPGSTVGYGGMGSAAEFWTISENTNPLGTGWDFVLYNNSVNIYEAYDYKGVGFPVRCIKD